MAVTSRARATWTGDLASGSGSVSGTSSKRFTDVPVTWKARTEGAAGSTPEELLAAAHASCFAMAFSARLAKAGAPPERLEVEAAVTFDNAGGGWGVTTSELTVRGAAKGVDAAKFRELAEDAKENCPISKALKGNVRLAVKAELAP
ncbi:MAG TPA: OsmC family peroxiredoxin [Candidatus Limnocylindria bacterium]|nr:OsmC family peroxiredoxin [Candidatus Limnocylindria bacterium]